MYEIWNLRQKEARSVLKIEGESLKSNQMCNLKVLTMGPLRGHEDYGAYID